MEEPKPPLVIRVLRRVCPRRVREEIEGDLAQRFEADLKRFGEAKARKRLTRNALLFLRPGILRRAKLGFNASLAGILQSHAKITIRNLLRRKAYAFINIFGLALGIAVCLVIGKYVEFETSYEEFHGQGKNIYRVVSSLYTDGPRDHWSGYDLGPALQSDLPEVKTFVRVHDVGGMISVGSASGKQTRFKEPRIWAVDSTFFDVFTFRFIRGDHAGALSHANGIVLTETVARKYFGDADPVGKTLSLVEYWVPGLYVVSAVIEDVPPNSHFDFEILVPIHNLLQSEFYRTGNSRWDNFHTYFLVHQGADMAQLNAKIPRFIKKYRGDDPRINSKAALQFQPILDIHYSPDLDRPGTHRTTVYFFAVIAIFILVIAWINYINLSTARAMERAREVGVKKALGVLRKQLVLQFMCESFVVNLASALLAVGLAWLGLPLLEAIVGQSFSFDLTQPVLWQAMATLLVAGSVISGAYPSFVLSSFKTTEVIKGKMTRGKSGLSLRNGLVVFQFAASLLLIVGTFTINKQVDFMQRQERSFDTHQVVIVRGPEVADENGLAEKMQMLKQEFLRLSAVGEVATSFSVPGDEASLSARMRKLGKPEEESRMGNVYWVDPDFMALYNMPLAKGRYWNPDSQSDMESIIINEEAVRVFQLGTNEEALKEKMITPGGVFPILGVVKDHHWSSLKQPLSPMIFRIEKVSSAHVSLQLTGDPHQSMVDVETKFKSVFPDETFSYYFLDDFYHAQYKSEEQFEKLFGVFSAVAVVIGCLGLWGLASFTTLHRLKEISIRKVLGATAGSILYLLTSQFIKPLFAGSLIALPLLWWWVNEWLNRFPYRIQFSMELFVLPFGALMIVALLTTSFQTLRAANTNPVNSLKNE